VPVAAAYHRSRVTVDNMIRFNGLHFWLAFLGFFAVYAMIIASLVR
jgi:hypothetical protein